MTHARSIFAAVFDFSNNSVDVLCLIIQTQSVGINAIFIPVRGKKQMRINRLRFTQTASVPQHGDDRVVLPSRTAFGKYLRYRQHGAQAANFFQIHMSFLNKKSLRQPDYSQIKQADNQAV
jgi:hypothetical protein